MLKLVKLEWKKNNITKYTRCALITSLAMLLFILLTAKELEAQETVEMYGENMLIAGVDLFNNIAFIIFTCVMLSAFSVSPYQNKTIYLMFSYPIKRRKIMAAQILAVWSFNFLSLVLSKLFSYCVLLLTKTATAGSIPLGHYEFYLNILIGSAAIVSISFLSLFVGLRLKSSKAAIVTGVIIACFTQGNIGSYTLSHNLPFYCSLLLLSFAAVFLSVYSVETKDVL